MRKYHKIILITVSVALIFLCILLVKLYDVLVLPSNQVVEEISERIETEPNWDAINQYIQDTPIGSSKAQVHERLDKIGLYNTFTFDTPEWDPYVNQFVYKEQIFFKETNTAKALEHWIFFYDENELLMRVSHATM